MPMPLLINMAQEHLQAGINTAAEGAPQLLIPLWAGS